MTRPHEEQFDVATARAIDARRARASGILPVENRPGPEKNVIVRADAASARLSCTAGPPGRWPLLGKPERHDVDQRSQCRIARA